LPQQTDILLEDTLKLMGETLLLLAGFG